MSFKYKHEESEKFNLRKRYAGQLVRWLISRGDIPANRKVRILDLGSGLGFFYFAFKDLGYKNTSACDICPEFEDCIKADITKRLPFKQDFFDLIISRDLIEHISEQEKFFNELFRILKPGGKAIIMTPNAERMSLAAFFSDYTHKIPYTRSSLKQAFEMHGFENIDVSRLRAIPVLWKYSFRAFDFLFSTRKNNLLAIARKPENKK